MPNVDLTTALGLLLSRGELRAAFHHDPHRVAADFGLAPDDLDTLLQIPADDLNFQASVLLRKRLNALRRLASETCEALGEDLWPLLEAYAQTSWPATDLEDADRFLGYLQERRHPGHCAAEHNRIRFRREGRKWAAHMVHVRLRGRRRRTVQILLAFGHHTRQIFLRFAL